MVPTPKDQAKGVITIEEDEKLPEAKRITISHSYENIAQRVKIFGWAHKIRGQVSEIITNTHYFILVE